MRNKKDGSKNAESTVIWKTTVKPEVKGNIVQFPTHLESTYQEIPVHHEKQVRLKIVSSGFGRNNTLSTRMQLAA
ncbi:hypothetical protein [Shimazuella kribbensis]|uniref:hypothetical protein n=1 Tax=Shimazuella kribbensis TaxID=139808 RepID=UPI000418BEA9|nr:hypothetical protein [Shimazuella kribbensis]